MRERKIKAKALEEQSEEESEKRRKRKELEQLERIQPQHKSIIRVSMHEMQFLKPPTSP